MGLREPVKCRIVRYADLSAGFHWKRATESRHPVDNKKASVMLSSTDDMAAAIAGAGGGRSLGEETE